MTCHLTLPYAPTARDVAHALAREVHRHHFWRELHWACALEAFWRTTPITYPSKRAMVAMLAGGER